MESLIRVQNPNWFMFSKERCNEVRDLINLFSIGLNRTDSITTIHSDVIRIPERLLNLNNKGNKKKKLRRHTNEKFI